MKLLEMDTTQAPIQSRLQMNAKRFFAFAMACNRLRAGWRLLAGRVGVKRKRRTLTVRESAALGDRRFVLVIQVGRQRFLIGSSSSSVTLLAQLPDQFPDELTREDLTSNAGERI